MDEYGDEESDEEVCDFEPRDDDDEEDVQMYLDQVLNGYGTTGIAMLNQSIASQLCCRRCHGSA